MLLYVYKVNKTLSVCHDLIETRLLLDKKKLLGVSSLTALYQICLPYAPCRLSPPATAYRFFGSLTTFAVLVLRMAFSLVSHREYPIRWDMITGISP